MEMRTLASYSPPVNRGEVNWLGTVNLIDHRRNETWTEPDRATAMPLRRRW